MNERTTNVTVLLNDYQALTPESSVLDQLEILAELVRALTGDGELVIFHWSADHGECYDCGLPAAFKADLYRTPKRTDERDIWENQCAVCAANAAANGHTIVRIQEEP